MSLGQRNIYPWVSQGWDGGDSGGVSDDDLFVGMMKAYYTAGAIGAVSGYFTCSGAPFEAMRTNGVVGAATPTQIRNLFLLGEVHALFSHLEPFLREGDLLPGTDKHPYQSFAQVTPAMEFTPVGEVRQTYGAFSIEPIRTARVIARKMKSEDKWLVTAWANTGNDRDIRLTIDPKLGELTLRARKAGSVYVLSLADNKTVIQLVDRDGMNPTAELFP